jgi:glycosyltransferase involved in cell wall biosynthesis
MQVVPLASPRHAPQSIQGAIPASMPLISAITTCKGRLAHLKQTLPSLMALPDCEVVVVDYDCPQGAGAWVQSAFPAAKVVRVRDRPHFKVAEARNRGVAEATAPWLFLIDADVAVEPTFVAAIAPLLLPGVFLRPTPLLHELYGTLVVASSDLAEIGGYDEVFEGWGSEDVDLVRRLESTGRREETFPAQLLAIIPHGDELRGRYHSIGNPRDNLVVNSLYRRIKADLRALGVELNEERRRAVYAQIRQSFLSPEGLTGIELAFSQQPMAGKSVLTTSLRYSVRGA